ncbi:hypothetical protein Q8A67_023236 [Cirrhinus molitorella]|uniref:Uncharacterized protein n=1 Tax=Cirrhinus molitorella TaxID=172907 RepID=A0AA88P331_9TELE|nr:hypothetical protein Q8A67_023236 [Cirrhinus molitorella]
MPVELESVHVTSAASRPVHITYTVPGSTHIMSAASGPTHIKPAAPGPTHIKPAAPGPTHIMSAASGPTHIKPAAPGPTHFPTKASRRLMRMTCDETGLLSPKPCKSSSGVWCEINNDEIEGKEKGRRETARSPSETSLYLSTTLQPDQTDCFFLNF